MDNLEEKSEEFIQKVLERSDVPKFYVNGFVSGHSNADMILLLMQNGTPLNLLNMSFTTAKSLYQNLGDLISKFEAITNHTVMTMNDVANLISESNTKTTDKS